jgi:UDP-glucose 6-dehydrogenase
VTNGPHDIDVYIICVSTHEPEDMFRPQIDGLLSIIEDKISKEAKNGALVSIESTIPRGTSKKVFELLNHRLHVVLSKLLGQRTLRFKLVSRLLSNNNFVTLIEFHLHSSC